MDQFQLRLPDGMRDRLKGSADLRGRSINAEIVARLEGSYFGWPKITLPEELFERVKSADFDKRIAMEKEIERYAHGVVERELPKSHEIHKELIDAFFRYSRDIPKEERDKLYDQFTDVLSNVRRAAPKKPSE